MLRFQITYQSTFCGEWPRLHIKNNSVSVADVECSNHQLEFEINPVDNNAITLDWYNKTQKHTQTNTSGITNDQTFKIMNVRVDGIQIEEWFWTDGYYFPKYFKGFVEHHKSQRKNEPLPEKIKSQLQWHFPGIFTFPVFQGDFWNWYFDKKQSKEVIKFLDKDPDRIHKFRGSLDPCEDLVEKIRDYL